MARKLSFKNPTEETVQWVEEILGGVGLKVHTSFDLQLARETHTDCSCPHHGSDKCDCQMVVLLVYGSDTLPVSLVVHGRDGHTYLTIADTPGQRPPPRLVAAIFSGLTAENISRHKLNHELAKIA